MSNATHQISPGFLAKDLVEEVGLKKMRSEEIAPWREKKMGLAIALLSAGIYPTSKLISTQLP